jgi:lantibiotic modifying enzyme
MHLSRRDFVHGTVSAAAIAGLTTPMRDRLDAFTDAIHPRLRNTPLDHALSAARWIHANRVETEQGVTWPADSDQPDTLTPSLYSGTTGVILFHLEMYAATGDRRLLNEARAGADQLMNEIPETSDAATGLYTGVGGMAFCFAQAHRVTKETAYRDGALRCLEIIGERARQIGTGVGWPQQLPDGTEVYDIVSGAAGTGLVLLDAASRFEEPRYLQLAAGAGRRLLEVGQKVETGTKWAMSAAFPRLMPNFSHGTAGVAYFLARLHAATGEQSFLDGAIAGARYLQSVAVGGADGWRIFHHEPEGEDLFYLSWCHGPAGTARLFYALWQATDREEWSAWTRAGADGILATGIPERRTPGFWNNISQCCGDAGVGEFSLALHRITEDPAHLAFAERITTRLVERATKSHDGLKWMQAEHRVRPELLQAQTGFMQGAAGVGTYFLHLHAANRPPSFVLPDSPWG